MRISVSRPKFGVDTNVSGSFGQSTLESFEPKATVAAFI